MFFTTTCLDLFTFSFHFYFLTSSLRAAHLTHSVFLYYLTISQVTTLVILQLEFHQDFLISGKQDQICFFLLECKNKCSLRPLTRGKIKIRQMASPFVWLFLASGFSFISIWIVTVHDCIIHATWSMQRRKSPWLLEAGWYSSHESSISFTQFPLPTGGRAQTYHFKSSALYRHSNYCL